jgi:hypothetical protein
LNIPLLIFPFPRIPYGVFFPDALKEALHFVLILLIARFIAETPFTTRLMAEVAEHDLSPYPNWYN